MTIPIYGFVKGDSLGLLIVMHDHERIRDIAERVQTAASVRVEPSAKANVVYHDRVLPLDSTIADCGIQALDRVDIIPLKI